METLLLVTLLSPGPTDAPPEVIGMAQMPIDTARAVLAALHVGRDGALVAHQHGFDTLIDHIERALGVPHAATMRALLEAGRTALLRYDLHVFVDHAGRAKARCTLDGVESLPAIDLREQELDVVAGIAQRAAFAAKDPP